MERISDSTCAGKWVQYGKFQFKDISTELTTIDSPSDTDEFVRVDTSREKRMEDWKPAFLERNYLPRQQRRFPWAFPAHRHPQIWWSG